MKTIGIVLIILGIAMIVFREIRYTREKEVVDLGPIELNKKEQKRIAWPTYAGIAIAICGVVVLIATSSKKIT